MGAQVRHALQHSGFTDQRNHRLLEQLSIHPETIEYLTERLRALDTWRHWANGQTI